MEQVMELRAHHLLCMPMYSGHGYSEDFCRHMEEVIKIVRMGNVKLRILASPDEVCSSCPNLQPPSEEQRDLEGARMNLSLIRSKDGRLTRRSCKHETKTAEKDSMLLQAFGLTEGTVYSIAKLAETVKNNMTEESFEKSCHKCSWREQGLCSYQMWQEGFDRLFCG